MSNETSTQEGTRTRVSEPNDEDMTSISDELAEPELGRVRASSVIETIEMSVYYGDFRAVADVSLDFARNQISALIGPSGCGKSTVLRSLNRMNDLVPTARTEGEVRYHGENIYADGVDPVEVRRTIGMVFQKPNPFPKSIFDNIAWGARINGFKGSGDGRSGPGGAGGSRALG